MTNTSSKIRDHMFICLKFVHIEPKNKIEKYENRKDKSCASRRLWNFLTS